MKKLYAVVASLLFVGATFAQQQGFNVPKGNIKAAHQNLNGMPNGGPVNVNQNPSTNAAPTVYWSDNFDTPANWDIDNATGTTGDWSIVSGNQAWVGQVQGVSGGNFAYLNSDALGDGVNTDAYITTANPINLSNVNAVWFTWYQSYQAFQDDCYVGYSTDGVNFSYIQVNEDISPNQGTTPDDFRFVDLTGLVTNQAAVWLRFRYDCAFDYAWGVDDPELVSPPNNELVLGSQYFRGFQDSSTIVYYSNIPVQHASLDTLVFGARINNTGIVDQPNTTFEATVSGAANWTASNSFPADFASGTTDSINLDTFFVANQQGTYDYTFNTFSDSLDELLVNNMSTQSVNVTETVYARDFDDYSGWTTYAAGTDIFQVCTAYEIFQDEIANSVTIRFGGNVANGSGTDPGAVVNIHIYDANLDPFATIPFVTIDPSWVGEWTTIDFPTPVNMPAGFYAVGFETLNATDEVWIGTGEFPPVAPNQVTFGNVGNAGWFFTTSFIPFIRLNVEPSPCSATMSSVVTDVSCNGDVDGAINLSVGQGNPPFNFAWSDGSNTEDISGLAPGNYTITLTDDIACTHTQTFTVAEPGVLNVDSVAVSIDACEAGTGSAMAMVDGGTAPFNYMWSDNQNTAMASNLGAGAYTVAVTDANGCTTQMMATVGSTPAVTASDMTIASTCDSANGSSTISVNTGTAPYTYTWMANGDTTATSDSLASGNYMVNIMDANGCALAYNVFVADSGAPVVASVMPTVPQCNAGNDGTVTLMLDTTGLASPVSYMWSTADTTQNLAAVPTGSYFVTITDANGCASFASTTVLEPSAIGINETSVTNVSCNGADDGAININAFGGTGMLTFAWPGGETTQNVAGLDGGSYIVTVTDANGCTGTLLSTVIEPMTFSISANGEDVACFGEDNGEVTVAETGGTAPFDYAWSTGQSSDELTNLAPGNYSVTVTDVNGCTSDGSASIAEPSAALTASLVNVVDENMGNDGSVAISAAGGTAPYTYNWSNGGNNAPQINSLVGGTYTVTVTDNNGCNSSISATVAPAVGIEEGINRVDFNLYPNPSNGQVFVTFGNSAEGNHVIIVTDVLGKVVYNETVDLQGSELKTIDLTNVKQGAYFFTIRSATKQHTEKIIIR